MKWTIFFFVLAGAGYLAQAVELDDSRLRELFREGVLEDGFGHTAQARVDYRKIIENAPKESPWFSMAQKRLCRGSCAPFTVDETGATSSQKKTIAELRSLLGSEIDGLQVSVVANRVVLDGEVPDPRDLERVQTVAQLLEVTNLVRLAPEFRNQIAQLAYNDINLPEVEVRAVGSTIVLRGFANGVAERDRCEAIALIYAKRLSGTTVLNLVEIKALEAPAARARRGVANAK